MDPRVVVVKMVVLKVTAELLVEGLDSVMVVRVVGQVGEEH